jgi:hypothetical protein
MMEQIIWKLLIIQAWIVFFGGLIIVGGLILMLVLPSNMIIKALSGYIGV